MAAAPAQLVVLVLVAVVVLVVGGDGDAGVIRQTVHWGFHKEECARLAEQMSRIDMLKQFPFTFSVESPAPNHTFPSLRCFLLESFKLHQKGLWKSECICDPEVTSVKDLSKTTDWSMGSALCPCTEPEHNVSTPLTSWKDYYRWRSLPLQSPVAVLLHWDSKPHLIVAPNAGIAAYPSWIPTIEIIRKVGIPAIFTDFCEEAAHLASSCITSITGQPLRVPIQVNPFRQPVAVDNSALCLPCYSNCFVFGMQNCEFVSP
uniref:Mitochondrial splicing suppressor 51-like C-terminal domain-containing protein n=1 Tax=Oryza barthii TaxID=65489 RepID=A0A0D3GQZ5_9ORYZ